jgi:hypothetical protein
LRASTEVQTPRARILLADDEAHVREVLRHFLARGGYAAQREQIKKRFWVFVLRIGRFNIAAY